MNPTHDVTMLVTTDWRDWRAAEARLEDLRDVHWHQPDGAPRSIVCASLSCAHIIGGHLSHQCDLSSAPHLIKVYIFRSRNLPSAYAEAMRRADGARVVSAVPTAGCTGYPSSAVGER